MNTMYQTLNTLYSHAQAHMSADQLDTVATTLSNAAVSMAQDMSTLLEGAGCLIANEGMASEEGRSVSGSLQSPDSIFHVLCAAAAKFDMLAGMIEVANEAEFKARQKRESIKE